MDGLPVTIRLLDPPLHEFLPHEGPALADLCKQLATELHSSSRIVRTRLEALREANPMMGLRGCRLGVVHPEISHMQATAIFEAAAAVVKKGGRVYPHIMVRGHTHTHSHCSPPPPPLAPTHTLLWAWELHVLDIC